MGRAARQLPLDEGDTAPDPKTGPVKVWSLGLSKIAEQKLTAMMVTHNMKDALTAKATA